MRGFVFDENLPRKLRFRPSLPVTHATQVEKACSDSVLWEYARRNHLALVSKDADFSERIFIASPPPWIVHLKVGNLSRDELHPFLRQVWPKIEELLPANKLVSVYLDRIESLLA